MYSILVGIDGSERGQRALDWAAAYAERVSASLTLVAVADPSLARQAGTDVEHVRTASEGALASAKEAVAAQHPGVQVETEVVEGKIVDALVDAAEGHNLIVMGSHHGSGLADAIGGAKGLRVSVSVHVPTVVIPSDWDSASAADGIVVGVGPDQTSSDALTFAVNEAVATGQPLELVSAWGLPPVLSKPAEAMGGGLAPVGIQYQKDLDERARLLADAHPGLTVTGRSVEGPSPAKTLVEESRGKRMLVLGTHSRDALGRALFGSVTHGVLLNLAVPTVIVPLA